MKKWSKDHQAAVSITYDAFWGKDDPYYHDKFRTVENEVLKRNLRMDFEMVTAWYDYPDNQLRQAQLAEMRETEIPAGVHFFGHGHHHIKYDDVSADSAYADFKRCFDLMTQWGLQPRAYAYPGGGGRTEKDPKSK